MAPNLCSLNLRGTNRSIKFPSGNTCIQNFSFLFNTTVWVLGTSWSPSNLRCVAWSYITSLPWTFQSVMAYTSPDSLGLFDRHTTVCLRKARWTFIWPALDHYYTIHQCDKLASRDLQIFFANRLLDDSPEPSYRQEGIMLNLEPMWSGGLKLDFIFLFSCETCHPHY